METLDCIMNRTSIRRYTDEPIPEDAVKTILKAGMSGPTAVNARDWSFVVITDREMLNKMADGNGRAAEPLRGAALGILICGDRERSYNDYWVIDGAIAGQNMILAAKALGIGSVWLGTWPQEAKTAAQTALFNLPDSQVPHSIIAFGYPAENPAVKGPEWEEDRVHYGKW